ncbi:MAG: hypothetical protein GXP31_07775 [Kiritimatiellaeota bacterium]|nr:hypothetical protein [Kiritimatiellota bacterium]
MRVFLLANLLITVSGCAYRTLLQPGPSPPSVLRTVQPGTSVNVLDYGADPKGEKDCAAAFEAAFRAALPHRRVHVRLPPGRFLLRRAAQFEIRGNTRWTGVHFEGAGQNVTQLVVDNDEGGLFFKGPTTNRLTVELSGLSLVARRNGAGSAVRFDKANPGVKHNRQFMVRNVEVRGETFAQGFFRRGFDVRNAWFPYFSNVTVGDRYGPSIPEDAPKMEFAFYLLDCYNPKFLTCHVWNGRCGLYYGTTREDSGPEDGTISNCYFVGNERCIVVQLKRRTRRWEEPALHITDCHINYRDRGIVFEGLREATISLCLFYCTDRKGSPFFKGGPSRNFTPVDVDLVFAGDILITHNIFTEPSNPKRIAVRIGKDSGNILVAGNQFNIEGTAIRNESPRESFSSGNFFRGRRNFSQGLVKYADLTGTLVKKDLN